MEKNKTESESAKIVNVDVIVSPSHIKSYVRRDSRMTAAQSNALNAYYSLFGIEYGEGTIAIRDFVSIFGRKAPVFVEIGFGSGQSLIALAKAQPHHDFIGIETHKPGIGALLAGVVREGVRNLRVMYGDVYDIFQRAFAFQLFAGIQIFFPDPWPKRRHYPRRLIQHDFINLVANKLKLEGTLHLATDWDDYAKHMLKVMSAMQQFVNESDGTRSILRPVITKFEARAIREGRKISDFKFRRI